MTRRTLWALSLSAVAALAAWILISRDGREPRAAASGAKHTFSIDASQGDVPASTPGASAGPGNDGSAATRETDSAASAFAQRTEIYARAAAADEAGLAELIEQARSIPDAAERVAALEILLLRLAERDASTAVRIALESERADAMQLIGALAANAPETVWRELSRVGDPLARTEFQRTAVDAWTLRDPGRAFRNVAAMPQDWSREQLLRQAAWGAARGDPQAALELVRSMPASERDPLYAALADQWSRRDPGAAAQWIESLPVRMQGQLAYRIAGPFLAQQPDEALAWALRISRSPGRNLWSHMIGLIATRDPDEALRRAQAAENPAQRAQAMARAVAAIAVRDPALATTYANKLPPGEARSQAINEVATQIARTQPDAALDWLREIKEHDIQAGATYAIASELAGADVDAAARLIDRVPKDMRPHWIHEVAQAYAEFDPERGLEWIDRWRDEAPNARMNFMQRLAMRNPEEALELADRIDERDERDQVMTQVIGMLAMQSPESAARRLGAIRDESARTRAAGALAAGWARHDEQSASKWARSLEAGRIRDTALGGVVAHIQDLDDVLEAIGDIQSPDLQMHAVFNAASRRGRTDPEGMRALLRRYPLDPGRQQQLDAMLRTRRD
jgi:hypothetical protein